MIKSNINPKITSLIERYFNIAGFAILFATLAVGLYFNKFDDQEKQKNNLQKIHSMLSQLIVPSMIISDFSELRRILFMASGKEETFIVVDNDRTIIMPDYEKTQFSKFILNYYKSIKDCKHLEATYHYIGEKQYLINCSVLENNDVLSSGKTLGVLLSFTSYKLFSFSPIIFYFIIFLIFLFIASIFLFRNMLYRNLLQPLIVLKNSISGVSMHALSTPHIGEIKNAPAELIEIKGAFERLLINLKEEYRGRIEAEKMNAMIDLAAGVAHDIRSPLTALDIIIKDIKNIPEEQRIVIRNAANRISDIANNLLTQYRHSKNQEANDNVVDVKSELISELLLSLISEKRAQYRNEALKFLINIDEEAYGKFAVISASTFNRVLSNLIDNSKEAGADQIKIILSILSIKKQNQLLLKIQDNGCGIPENMLHKIINGERFSTKESGNGLGLPHAIKTIEKEWGGNLNIKLKEKSAGTIIEILLPEATPPEWFLSQLTVNPRETIVILDDDESIHQVWSKRFDDIHCDLKFINYYNPQEVLSLDNDNLSTIDIFLIDYEFIGCDESGLDIIEKLNIADHSYLVTSRHEDHHIRERCRKIGLKIIPKAFAVYIPIILTKIIKKSVDLIFIDDDSIITDARPAWKNPHFCRVIIKQSEVFCHLLRQYEIVCAKPLLTS